MGAGAVTVRRGGGGGADDDSVSMLTNEFASHKWMHYPHIAKRIEKDRTRYGWDDGTTLSDVLSESMD